MKIIILKLLRIIVKIPFIGNRIWGYVYKSDLWKDVTIKEKIFNGLYMSLNVEDWVQKKIFMEGVYEKDESILWEYYTKGKQVVLDIGANVGYYSIIASNKVDKNFGRVFSFEPISVNYNKAIENFKLNKLLNISLQKLAVSNFDGEVEINRGEDENLGMSSLYKHDHLSGQSELVPVTSIDSFFRANKLESLDLVKIDVEGNEMKVLLGMEKSIVKYRPVIFVEVLDQTLKKAGNSKEDLFDFFEKLDYQGNRILKNKELSHIKEPVSIDGLICFIPN